MLHIQMESIPVFSWDGSLVTESSGREGVWLVDIVFFTLDFLKTCMMKQKENFFYLNH